MSNYREKLLEEIQELPEGMIPKLYKIIHVLTDDLLLKGEKTGKRGSLKGIWEGSYIDETLFRKAKESLFPYEYK